MPLYLPPEQRRPDPRPLRTDDRKAVLVGTAMWAVLLVVTLVVREDLTAADRAWWPWSCVAGVVLGLVGLVYLQRRQVGERQTPTRP